MLSSGTQQFFSFYVTVSKIDGESFDGPLEILWELIKSYQVDIFSVSLEKITEDFLSYTKKHQSSLNEISEFTLMGTQLLFYKSKLLLPEIYSDDENLEGSHRLPKELIDRLLEYKQIQLVLTKIRTLEKNSHTQFTQKTPYNLFESETSPVQLDLKDFITSFKEFLHQKEQNNILEIEREEIDFFHVKNEFTQYINVHHRFSFLEYVKEMSLLKAIKVFLILLDIIQNNQNIFALQDKNNKDIYIHNNIFSSY